MMSARAGNAAARSLDEDEVVRPALPLLLLSLAGAWGGIYLAWQWLWRQWQLWPLLLLAAMLLGAALLLWRLPGCRRPSASSTHRRPLASILPARRQPLALRSALRSRQLPAAVLAMAAGIVLGSAFWLHGQGMADRVAQALAESPASECRLTIVEDVKPGAISDSSIADLELPGCGQVRVRVFWRQGQQPLPMGSVLWATARFKPLNEQQAFLHQKGVLGSVSLDAIRSEGFPGTPLGQIYAFREHNRMLLTAHGGEGAALLKGALLGETTELNATDAGRAFKASGLSHLVAVSGSHLVVIAAIFAWLLRRLHTGRLPEMLLLTVVLVAYVLLTGLQPSAIRACAMAAIASLAPLVGRRAHVPSALSVAALCMLCIYPPTAFSVGFWLSVFAVFGLTLFFPLVSRYFGCLLPGAMGGNGKKAAASPGKAPVGLFSGLFSRLGLCPGWAAVRKQLQRFLVEPLALTTTAQLATMPITSALFATIALVSPLANLLVSPFIVLLVAVGIVALCLLPLLGGAGGLLLGLLCQIAEIAVAIAKWSAALPYASLPIAVGLPPAVALALGLAALLYRFWPQPSRKRALRMTAALAVSAVLFFGTIFLPVGPRLVMLDIGQGDAILIRDGSTNILVDTGQDERLLYEALARQRVFRLDAIIITHLDKDHCGALSGLIGTVAVEHIYFADGLSRAQAGHQALSTAGAVLGGREPESIGFGDSITVGRHIQLVMLWPVRPASFGSNAESICLALQYDYDSDGRPEYRLLLTGDAEDRELQGLLAKTDDDRFDILKVGHHGSRDAVSLDLLQRIDCDVALISAGRNNRYGHPNSDTLEQLEQSGVVVFRTDLHGDISVLFKGYSLSLRCDNIDDG
jgi:competence protein ComEC